MQPGVQVAGAPLGIRAAWPLPHGGPLPHLPQPEEVTVRDEEVTVNDVVTIRAARATVNG